MQSSTTRLAGRSLIAITLLVLHFGNVPISRLIDQDFSVQLCTPLLHDSHNDRFRTVVAGWLTGLGGCSLAYAVHCGAAAIALALFLMARNSIASPDHRKATGGHNAASVIIPAA